MEYPEMNDALEAIGFEFDWSQEQGNHRFSISLGGVCDARNFATPNEALIASMVEWLSLNPTSEFVPKVKAIMEAGKRHLEWLRETGAIR